MYDSILLLARKTEEVMPQLANAGPDRLADHFVNYLFDTYKGSRHVRRVASWVGLIVKGIEKLNGNLYIPRDRQLRFDYKGRTFKAKFNHRAGGSQRGGIEIVEILPGRGSPEGKAVRSITNLDEAAAFYDSPNKGL
jgi:hypothetical protein